MKAVGMKLSKLAAAFALVAVACAASLAQQPAQGRGRLRLESLDRLAPKASETVNVEVDSNLIELVVKLLSDKDPEEKQIKELAVGLKGVYVKSFEFKDAGQFTEGDLSQVRAQLGEPLWSRMIDIRTRGESFGEAEVYVAREGGRVEGFTLLSVQPKEITIINIVGSVDLEKLRALEDTFNLPKIRIERKLTKSTNPSTPKKN